ncbi:MAG: hypothetical protein RL071_3606 [Pseudomonadota bacterium]
MGFGRARALQGGRAANPARAAGPGAAAQGAAPAVLVTCNLPGGPASGRSAGRPRRPCRRAGRCAGSLRSVAGRARRPAARPLRSLPRARRGWARAAPTGADQPRGRCSRSILRPWPPRARQPGRRAGRRPGRPRRPRATARAGRTGAGGAADGAPCHCGPRGHRRPCPRARPRRSRPQGHLESPAQAPIGRPPPRAPAGGLPALWSRTPCAIQPVSLLSRQGRRAASQHPDSRCLPTGARRLWCPSPRAAERLHLPRPSRPA